MWTVHFYSPVDKTTLSAVEGPFASQLEALDYIDQRDHMLDFIAKPFKMDPARFTPDQSYLAA